MFLDSNLYDLKVTMKNLCKIVEIYIKNLNLYKKEMVNLIYLLVSF